MESTLLGHPERVMPFVVRNYRIRDMDGNLLYERKSNYQTMNTLVFTPLLETFGLVVEVDHPSKSIPAAIVRIEFYQPCVHWTIVVLWYFLLDFFWLAWPLVITALIYTLFLLSGVRL